MIRALIFDMDGLLIDSESMYDQCWLLAAPMFNIDGKKALEVRMSCLGKTDCENIKALEKAFADVKDFNPQAFYSETDRFAWKMKCQPKAFAKEILVYLKAKGYKLGLATSSGHKAAERFLSDAGLSSFFSAENMICGSDMDIPSKPAPDIYLASCAKIHCPPEECAAVEDSPSGIKSAISAGMKAILVPDRLAPDSFSQKNAWKISASLKDLELYL